MSWHSAALALALPLFGEVVGMDTAIFSGYVTLRWR
jgi:hypothetical protein